MATKAWIQGQQTGGGVPHIRIVRQSDAKNWDGSSWISSETLLAFTEVFPGFYRYEVTAAWEDCTVDFVVYETGLSTVEVMEVGTVRIVGDQKVEGALLAYLTASNASKPVLKALEKVKSDIAGVRERVVALESRLSTATQIGN